MDDFCSEEFDALSALQSGRVAPWLLETASFKRGAPLDRVELCRSVLEKPYKLLQRVKVERTPAEQGDRPETRPGDLGDMRGSSAMVAKHVRITDSLARVGAGLTEVGPIARLRKWTGARIRVRIRDRPGKDRMEELLGELLAMDKHFNLILKRAYRTGSRGIGMPVPIGQVLLRGETVVWVARWSPLECN